ncbi:hypothetical protein [Gordonia sp. N1V]|uniref:hypothetical protein n=1 Tax=Gordonia sp. N1V TaxID=3034163 RepID=UPI0023E1B34B|nr:hypothetical protein [Gordonia sp. N1V]MDF3285035.1 hypothetical protein [Gordonia sp. N1V]
MIIQFNRFTHRTKHVRGTEDVCGTRRESRAGRLRRHGRSAVLLAWSLVFSAALLGLTDPGVAAAATRNPFDGVTPDLSLFGPALNNTWTRVLGATWAACLAYTGWRWVTAAASVRAAKTRGSYGDVAEGKEQLAGASWALGLVACAGVIVGAILFIVGTPSTS